METLTTVQVAKLLGVHRTTVTRMLENGLLRTADGQDLAYRITPVSPRKIRRDLLEQYIAENNVAVDWSLIDSTDA